MHLLLLSQSEIKINALQSIFPSSIIDTINVSDSPLQIAQPLNFFGSYRAAYQRVSSGIAKLSYKWKQYDWLVAIENYMNYDEASDYVCIIFYKDGLSLAFNYFCAEAVDKKLFYDNIHFDNELGCHITYGSLLHQKNNSINPCDWMSSFGKSRLTALKEALDLCKIHFGNYF